MSRASLIAILLLACTAAAGLAPPLFGPAVTLADDDGRGGDDGDDRDDGDDGDDGDDADDGPSAAPSDRDADSGSFLGRLFGEGRDAARGEIVGLGLDAAARGALQAAGFTVVEDRALSGLGARITRLRMPEGTRPDRALADARRIAPRAAFDLNHYYQPLARSCTGAGCWSAELAGLDAPAAETCRAARPVAIIDTLPDLRHPALRGARIETRSFLASDMRAADPAHGTAVAALLVGRPAPGQAPLLPGVRLLAAGAFELRDGRSVADVMALVRSLDWAIAERAGVVAFSLSGPENAILGAAVKTALTRASLVAAAGNAGPRGPAAYPAAWKGVIAVAAVDRRKRAYRNGTRGDYIDIAAPGVGVLSAGPGGGVQEWTGTSFAVPYAVAAVLRARVETGGDPGRAKALLLRLAEDLGAAGPDPVFGAGLLRAPQGPCRRRGVRAGAAAVRRRRPAARA